MRPFPLLLLALFTFGQHSQPPSPTPSKATHVKQEKSKPEEQQTERNERAAKELTSAILQLRAEIAAWNQQQAAAANKDDASAKWIRRNAFAVTFFTAILAVVAILQWRAMHRQANIADRQTALAEKQTEIGEKQADIAAEQLRITQAAETRRDLEKMEEENKRGVENQIADKRYLEQLTLAKDNAYAAKKSADAAQASTKVAVELLKLQEVAQKQWINLEGWSTFRHQPDDLEISFNLVNPTRVPLTLHMIVTSVGGGQKETFGQVTLITPGNPFIHSIGIKLNEEQKNLFDRDALSLTIECSVFFADALGLHWQQDFGRMILCSRSRAFVTDTKNTLRESGVPGERGSRDVELP
jgi:hypothetical protein